MDLELNIAKKGLSTTESVINEEFTLRYGNIFRGKSAYEYAKDGGYQGSEQEFIHQLATIGENTIIVDFDRIKELKNSEEGEGVTHPEIAELVEKIYNEQEKLILVRHFANTYEQLDPTYFVPDTNYGRDEFGDVIITLFASYTPTYNTYGEQSLIGLEVSITQAGAIIKVEQTSVTLLNEESVIDNLNSSYNKKPLSAKQGKELDRKKVGYAEYDSENKAIMLYSDNTKKYALGEIPIESISDNGYYPKMTVGKADNLVGRGEATAEEFSFRPSAGDVSIEDGTARITSVKGNSVVYNQLATKSNVSIEQNNSANESAQSFNIYNCAEYLVIGRWYYIDVVKNNVSGVETIRYGNITSSDTNVLTLGKVVQCIANSFQPSISYTVGGNTISTGTITPIIIDLTKMFGAGNEPTTYEEYLQRKPMNIEDEFAYNEGEIISMNVNEIKSVGNNAYDYTNGYAKVIGGKTYNFDGEFGEVAFSTTIEGTKGSISVASGGKYTFAENGYVWLSGSDICVCLQHSYEKPITPYEDDTIDLSWVRDIKDSEGNLLFPDGLSQTPLAVNDSLVAIADTDAYDEIRYNRTTKKWEAVKRIGKVSGVTFQSTDAANVFIGIIPDLRMATQGVYHERRNGLLTAKYGITLGIAYSNMSDKAFLRAQKGQSADGAFFIKDTAYSTVADFNEANKDLVIYYELAEPIVTEIEGSENWNLDYLVWDFGTEEAIASQPSASFRADIIYQFNAVDRIRDNDARIAELEVAIKQLQSQIATITIN